MKLTKFVLRFKGTNKRFKLRYMKLVNSFIHPSNMIILQKTKVKFFPPAVIFLPLRKIFSCLNTKLKNYVMRKNVQHAPVFVRPKPSFVQTAVTAFKSKLHPLLKKKPLLSTAQTAEHKMTLKPNSAADAEITSVKKPTIKVGFLLYFSLITKSLSVKSVVFSSLPSTLLFTKVTVNSFPSAGNSNGTGTSVAGSNSFVFSTTFPSTLNSK